LDVNFEGHYQGTYKIDFGLKNAKSASGGIGSAGIQILKYL